MATTTENLGLTKPAETDYYDVNVFNANADLIDAAIETKANKISPTFTGTPKAPTAPADTNSTQIATTAFVQTTVGAKANKVSPTFTGTPKAPTAPADTNSTQIATTAFVQTLVDDLKGSVSEGKAALASAITDKGVSTGSSDSFTTMAANIRLISTAPANGRKGTWERRTTLPSAQCWSAIAYGNGKIVMISGYPLGNSNGVESNVCCYSSDGLSWTQEALPSSHAWADICFGDGVFLAIAGTDNDGTNSRKCAKSVDGVTWSEYTSLPSSISATRPRLAYGRGKFVASIGNDKIAYSSNEGSTWTTVTIDVSSDNTTGQRGASIVDILYADGIFAVLCGNGKVAYSTDLIHWNYADIGYLSTVPSTGRYSNILYGKGTFVAVGYGCHAYSNNKCSSWNLVEAASNYLAGSTGHSCYGNGTFVGRSGYSISGVVPFKYDNNATRPTYIIYADNKFIGTHDNNFISSKEYLYSPTTVD